MLNTHNRFNISSYIRFRQIKLYALYKNPAFDRARRKLFWSHKRIDSCPENVKDLVLIPFLGVNNDIINRKVTYNNSYNGELRIFPSRLFFQALHQKIRLSPASGYVLP